VLESALEKLSRSAQEELISQGVPQARLSVVRRVHLRYDGTDSALIVNFGSVAENDAVVRVGLPHALQLPDAGPRIDRPNPFR